MTIPSIEINRAPYSISTDPNKLDLVLIHDFLANHSYWSRNIPFEIVASAAENSLNFGLYKDQQQIGYARVVTDYSIFAYLGDVFILPDFRRQGLSKWLIEQVMAHPNLQHLRRWVLLTGDAHELYRKYGWKDIKSPEKWMEKHDPEVYTRET